MRIPGTAALPAAASVLLLAACGTAAPPVTARGTFTPASEAASLFGGVAQYAACVSETPGPGTQVTVKSPSGEVIGTGKLGIWSRDRVKDAGVTIWTCAMPFKITGLPAEARYGFSVAGVPGTAWKTNIGHVALSAGG